MRKFFVFALLFAATAMFADDAVLVENFSKVGNPSAGSYNWEGDVCNWTAFQMARRVQDTIPTANQKQAIWFSISNYGVAKMTSAPLEGGIKAVNFKFARFGSEKTAGRVLQLAIAVNEIEDKTATYANNAMPQGAAATSPAHVDYSHAFNCKANNAVLTITNASTYTESLTNSGICRIMVADLTITPYLLYTTKEALLDLRSASTFTNTALINNTGGEVVYSISENTIGATINASTGEVSATKAGEVTVTATWDGITTSYDLTILAKEVATASFAKESLRLKLSEEVPANKFETNSTATVVFASSVPEVATVNASTGAVTLKGAGTTVITATVPENEDYTATEASYTIKVDPDNFNMETFDGAHNVDLATTNTYLTTPTTSFNPSTATGLTWTTLLGSVRDALGGSPKSNLAAVVRGKKTAESEHGYLLSSTISGGIDSIAFDWNANGSEASRTNPWDIEIYINDTKIGTIADAGTAVQAMGSWYRFTKGGLKLNGDFTIKIVNKNVADDGTSNHYRFVLDNLEWYSYCNGDFGIMVDGTKYIAGEWNKDQTGWLEYKIVANLEKDQTLVFYDNCAAAAFLAGQEEGGYWFTQDGDVFKAPNKGEYTIYLKMYGPSNNWIWTSFKDTATGIENEAIKADVRKAIENGAVVIYRNGVRYNVQGQAF